MKKSPLNVFATGQPVGTLSRSDVEEDTILFAYHQGCAPEAAVSLTMPVRVDQERARRGCASRAGRGGR
jgi:hypothetical protein